MIKIFPLYSAYSWLLPNDLYHLRSSLYLLKSQFKILGYPINIIELYLVDDKDIAKANFHHLGSKGPTNILSFPGDDIIPGILLLSLDTYTREYTLFGQNPVDYLFFLISHGFAHLVGLDHGQEMDELQNKSLELMFRVI